MPRGDGTGPMGMGAMTGRGAGFCTGYARPGYTNFGFGRGMGRGRGFMRWAGNYDDFAPNAQSYDEKAVLKNQEEYYENQLTQIKKRLNDLDK